MQHAYFDGTGDSHLQNARKFAVSQQDSASIFVGLCDMLGDMRPVQFKFENNVHFSDSRRALPSCANTL